MYCPNCNRQVPDGTKFCGGCGTPIHVTPLKPVRTESTQQPEAQNPAQIPQTPPVAPVAPVTAAPVNVDFGKAKIKVDVVGKIRGIFGDLVKKVPGNVLKIGGAVLAVLLVIVIIAGLFGGSKGGDYALYIKDEQLYFNDFSRNAPYEVTKDLYDGRDNSYFAGWSEQFSAGICVTEDGERLFYLDKLDSSSGTLYYRDTGKMGKDPVKLASGVTRYSVSKDGKTVTYLKNSTLYQHNLKDETKISRDVASYEISEDGKILYYIDTDSVVYVYYKGDSEKVGSDISVLYYTEDMKTVYYLDDDTLYKKPLGKDKSKLATDVDMAFGFGDDGTFYYLEEEGGKSLGSFFAAEDGYEDWIEQLNEESFTSYTLYYFDGKGKNVISENCSDYSRYGSTVSYTVCDTDIARISTDTLKERYYNSWYTLSEVATQLVTEAMQEGATTYLTFNGKTWEIELGDVSRVRVSPDGKLVYVLCDVDPESNEGDLYKASVSGDKIGKFEEVDDGVYSYSMYFRADEGSSWFAYFKDVEDSSGELCVDGKSVADDVYIYGVSYYSGNGLFYYTDYDAEEYTATLNVFNGKKSTEIADDVYRYSGFICENGNVAFLTDYRSEKEKGTLCFYDGKVKEVADDVHDFTFTLDGQLLYLYDYSTSSYRGDLALYNGKKSEKIDEDVVALLKIYQRDYYSFG